MRHIGTWEEHRSNLFFFLLGTCSGGTMIGAIGHAIANEVHGHPTDWAMFGCLLLLGIGLLAAGFWLTRKGNTSQVSLSKKQLLLPTVSALHGVEPEITFDPQAYFRLAYYSTVTAEIDQNIRVIARRYSPDDLEVFYAKFIGVGYVSTFHEYSWALIFGSQLRALAEINSLGIAELEIVKAHYDKAAQNNPILYADYSFDKWSAYLKARSLIVIHSTKMVEVTHYGRDFLKYIAHTGKDVNSQIN